MKYMIAAGLVAVATGRALADEGAVTTPPSTPMERIRDGNFAPYAAVRLGRDTALAGNVDAETSASDFAAGPTLFVLSTGARIRDTTVALAFGFGGGGATDGTKALFESADATPNGTTFTAIAGGEVEYRFRRVSRRVVPFVGGFLGWTTTSESGDLDETHRVSLSHSGLHVRATGGIDLVTSNWFAVGLAAEFALSRYGKPTVTNTTEDDPLTPSNEYTSEDAVLDVDGGTAVFAGLTVRAVFFP